MYKLILILSVIVVVSCFKPDNYCAKKYKDKCEEKGYSHQVGCVNSTRQTGTPFKLVKNEREQLAKYFNEIRNEIASSKTIANMHELKWSDEYEYLAEKAIEYSISDNECFWTENSKVFPSDLVIIKSASNSNGNWTIIRINGNQSETNGNPSIMNEVKFNKINNINYLLDEQKGEILNSQFSVFHDPISNLIGCSWDLRHNSTFNYKRIHCVINARQLYNASYYESGKPCTKCPGKSKCSKDFQNLCSSSNKFGISFWLMSCMIFLGFGKFIK